MALLIGPVRYSGTKTTGSCTCTDCDLDFVEVFHSHCLTFSGRHVDASAITAQWVWPPKSPGHVIEHRVVGPAEAAVVFVGVEPQPPVVSLHFRHLKVKKTEYLKGMSRP